jgi:hypothetical protein
LVGHLILTAKKSLINILLLALVGLSVYFIFLGYELVGIALLIASAILDYQLKKVKKAL